MTEQSGKLVFVISNNHCMMPDAFLWSYLRMMKPNGSVAVKGSSSVKASSITDGIYQALQMGAEWMFLMDVDQTFPRVTVPRLLETAKKHDAKIVSVLYHLGRPPYGPVAGWLKGRGDFFDYVNSKGQSWRDYYAPLGKGVVEVDWAGSGGLLVHRDVIRALEWPPFKDEWRDGMGTRAVGHDITFCQRAKKKGFKIFVDTSLNSFHGKLWYIGKEWAEAFTAAGMANHFGQFMQRQALESDYWDTVWQDETLRGYDRGTAPVYAATNARILEFVNPGDRVVDVGCGAGGLLKLIRDSERKPQEVFGIDFSEHAIDVLKKNGISGEVGDLRLFNPNGLSGHFDVVVSTHTIEHLQDDRRLLETMVALGRLGAIIVVATPSAAEIQGHFEHVRGYDSQTLKALLQSVGLKEVSVEDNKRDFIAYGIKEDIRK